MAIEFLAKCLLLVSQANYNESGLLQNQPMLISQNAKLVNVSGSNINTADTVDYLAILRQIDSTKSYAQTKAAIMDIKNKIDFSTSSVDSLNKIFTELLVFKIIPYWYGTPWAFEGYTAVPNQGEIACGYFVSTTLLHTGININRYKMAQQLPLHEALTLAAGEPLLEIQNTSVVDNIAQLDTLLSYGVYFLGFDKSHVGFILKQFDQVFVIHSNYIGSDGVTIEKIEDSQAFASYKRFYIAPISTNYNLMKKWILGEAITVIDG